MTPPRRRDLELSGATRPLGERFERVRMNASQPLSLCFSPSLELAEAGNAESIEERSAVPRNGVLEGSLGDRLLICPNIHGNDVRVETKRSARGGEYVGRQRAPEREDELLQVVARAVRVELRPQQGESAISRQSVVSRRRDEREQRECAAPPGGAG